MKTVVLWLYRQIAIGLVLLLAIPCGVAASAQTVPSAPTADPAQASPSLVPGAPSPTEIASLPSTPDPQPAPQNVPQSNQPASTPQTAPAQQNAPNQSMGTAAAPSEPATGVAASKPAGAAIAPAKQKRSRTFAIRVAILVGAAVAVGTVVGLSASSQSRP